LTPLFHTEKHDRHSEHCRGTSRENDVPPRTPLLYMAAVLVVPQGHLAHQKAPRCYGHLRVLGIPILQGPRMRLVSEVPL